MDYSRFIGVKCHHPVMVNGQLHNCGKCPYCTYLKYSNYNDLLILESKTAKSVFFVTLTFDSKFIPRMVVRPDESHLGHYYLFDNTPRLSDYYNSLDPLSRCEKGFFLGSFCMNPHLLQMLFDKVHSRGGYGQYELPYSCVRDHQLFLKRFRKYIYEQTRQKVRFYSISEYGPKRFRPHFHYLFFFDTQIQTKVVEEAVYKSWEYGNVSIDFVQGSCNSYVSKYVCGSCTLPAPFKLRNTQPRVFHSVNFGGQVLDGLLQAIPLDAKASLEQFNDVSIVDGKKVKKLSVRRQLENRRFPKCSGYSSKSFRLLELSYKLYPIAKEYYFREHHNTQMIKSTFDLAKFVFDKIYDNNCCWSFINDLREYYKGRYFLSHEDRCVDFNEFELEPCDTVLQSIYIDLLVSLRFHTTFFLEVDPNSDITLALSTLIDYYDSRDYQSLVRNLKLLEDYSKLVDDDFAVLASSFYDNYYDEVEVTNSLPYIQNKAKSEEYARYYRKHRLLNEANDIFDQTFIPNKNFSKSTNF